MNVMVVGSGGREHAIIRKLLENKEISKIYALPGNGGMAADAECVPIDAKDIPAIVDFAVKTGVDYAVVAPDDPLVLGCVDALEEKGIPCFGPRANAAIIEGSKVFSKNLMKKYAIPTAAYEVFDDMEAALAYLQTAWRWERASSSPRTCPRPKLPSRRSCWIRSSARAATGSSLRSSWRVPRSPCSPSPTASP